MLLLLLLLLVLMLLVLVLRLLACWSALHAHHQDWHVAVMML